MSSSRKSATSNSSASGHPLLERLSRWRSAAALYWPLPGANPPMRSRLGWRLIARQ